MYETKWCQLHQHPGRSNSISTLRGKQMITHESTIDLLLTKVKSCQCLFDIKTGELPQHQVPETTAFLQVFNKWENSDEFSENEKQFIDLSIFSQRCSPQSRFEPHDKSLASLLHLVDTSEIIPGLPEVHRSQVKYFPRHKYMVHSLENLAQPGRQPEPVLRLLCVCHWHDLTASLSFIYMRWQNKEDLQRDVKYLLSSSPSSVSCWHSALQKALEPIHLHPLLAVDCQSAQNIPQVY